MKISDLRHTLWAGITYAVIVFSVGFVLGVFRVLLLVPWLGHEGSVLIELPIILALSWVVCRRLMRAYGVSRKIWLRGLVGLVALGVLFAFEIALGVVLSGHPALDVATRTRTPAEILGLAAQCLYALFPIIDALLPSKPTGPRSVT